MRAVDRIITHADAARRLGVRANADTPEDARRARSLGAQGIGLCRTEHMFLGERRVLVEHVVLAGTDEERQAALDALLPVQTQDFIEIFEAMDGLPTTIRLIDPPLHEFLPDLTALSVKVAVAKERGAVDQHDVEPARGGRADARGQPDARPARCPARSGDPRPVRACRSVRSARLRPLASPPAVTRRPRSWSC